MIKKYWFKNFFTFFSSTRKEKCPNQSIYNINILDIVAKTYILNIFLKVHPVCMHKPVLTILASIHIFFYAGANPDILHGREHVKGQLPNRLLQGPNLQG